MDKAQVIRVVLADDHAVVRKGIREFLEEAGDIQVIAEATTGNQKGSRATTPKMPMAGAKEKRRKRVRVYSNPNISQKVKPQTTM